ncbi:MAG: MFS transporter [Opitutae bacterium]|nr:MFS transporter [Opitutae bacterium]
MNIVAPSSHSLARVYWTAFVGLFFDYYDLYLFIYLEKTLAAQFALGAAASNWLQFAGLAGVGVGALVFGYFADRFGRGRLMLVVFAVYAAGIAGISVAWSYESLLAFRLLASLALGAEWGISHTYLAERVEGARRYRLAALLQFSLLGGLLAAMAARFALPVLGWRWLFALSIVPVAALSLVRWRALMNADVEEGMSADEARALGQASLRVSQASSLLQVMRRSGWAFLLCFALASLTIASGTMNVFYAKELPQSPLYTVLFWGAVAPGMLGGAWLVRRFGVGRALVVYGVALTGLTLACRSSAWSGRQLAFALGLPLLNGIPFGLMGAFFNEVFADYRTMLSGAAYNLGRIAAGAAPWAVGALGLRVGDNYLLFTAILAGFVVVLGVAISRAKGRFSEGKHLLNVR